MILIGLGSNLPGRFPDSGVVLDAALMALTAGGIRVVSRSPFYRTAPIPVSDQPWFFNAVVAVETNLSPQELLKFLHDVEKNFGRERKERNESRVLDLDLLAYRDLVSGKDPVLPHPRLQDRAFVLYPLRDIAPDWKHPVTGKTAVEMAAALSGQEVEKVA